MADEVQRVAVVVPASPVALGDDVTATITIVGEPDHKVTGAALQLVRSAIHRFTQTNVVFAGYHDTVLDEHVVVAETPFATDRAATTGAHVVTVTVPADSLPSAEGQVAWAARAVIRRRLGHDVVAEAPVEVLSGPERFADEASEPARYIGERLVEIAAAGRTLRAGETVTGTITVRPSRAVTVTRVRVLFERTISVKSGLTGAFVVPLTLRDEPLELAAGDAYDLPFELVLPPGSPPTVRGSQTTPRCNAAITWEIAAQVAVAPSPDGQPAADSLALLGLNVYNTPPATG